MTAAARLDWGLGNYERTAEQLMPVARLLVDRAAPGPGERVVDLGCGTGNAALLCAARGARVTGVDPAARLLEVAREEAARHKLDADFVPGDGSAIPLANGEADLVVSVFGVIFAPDPQAAAGEIARVLAPGGRLVLSAWIPGGGISDSIRLAREAVSRALELPPGPPPFAWHDREELAGLLGPHGFDVSLEEGSLAFTAPSARDHLTAELENHPIAVAGQAVLKPRGQSDELFERMLEVLEAANEDPAGFRVTSRYVIATAERR
jgi:SAM-dependent methyltransferase